MRRCGACNIARYAVASNSTLEFEARSSLHPVHGSASGLSGYVDAEFDGAVLAADPPPRMHVDFPVEHLLIDSRRFPSVVAELRGAEPDTVSVRNEASGDITLAGRQRHYKGVLTVERAGERLQVGGELRVDIRDFGLQPPRFLMFKVEPEVNVRLRLTAAAKK